MTKSLEILSLDLSALTFDDLAPSHHPVHPYDFGEPAAPGSTGLCLKRADKLFSQMREDDFGKYLSPKLNVHGKHAVMLINWDGELTGKVVEYDSLEELMADWRLD